MCIPLRGNSVYFKNAWNFLKLNPDTRIKCSVGTFPHTYA